MNRRQSRENAFTLLFEWFFQGGEIDEVIRNALEARAAEIDEFAEKLARETAAHIDGIDALIEQYSEKWKISRLGKVTLASLRLAFCEITVLGDIPIGATINEAVELVKKFSTEDEAAYVNGVLGQYGRDREKAAKAPKPGDA